MFAGIVLLSDQEVVLYGRNLPSNGSTEVYPILPVPELGDDYVIMPPRIATTETTKSTTLGRVTSYLGLVATETGTEVMITLPPEGVTQSVLLRMGKQKIASGQTLTLELEIYETVQLESFHDKDDNSEDDLIGMRVMSNKPVALFTTHSITHLVNSTNASSSGAVGGKDGVVSQHADMVVPTHSWGRNFVVGGAVGGDTPQDLVYHVLGT